MRESDLGEVVSSNSLVGSNQNIILEACRCALCMALIIACSLRTLQLLKLFELSGVHAGSP